MMSLNSIKTVIENNKTFAIIPHKNPDGDAIGSSLALAAALKKLGKVAKIYTSGDFPNNLGVIWTDEFAHLEMVEPDVVISLDCADKFRMDEKEIELFDNAKITCVIDHHKTNVGFAKYSYVDASSAACGEIIYEFLCNVLKIELDKEIASYLYCAIICDTGNFKYSNTTSKTHYIVSKLMEYGINPALFSRPIFDILTKEQCIIMSEGIKNMKFSLDGKVCLSYISYDFLEKHNIGFEYADFFVSYPRDIDGVEVGIFLKVRSEDEIKASFRSNSDVDVSLIASEFDGGGHAKASGCTIYNKSIDETIDILMKRVEKAVNEQ